MNKKSLVRVFVVLFIACLFYRSYAIASEVLGVSFDEQKEILTTASGNSFAAGDIGYINGSGQAVLANALNSATAQGLLVQSLGSVSGGSPGTFRILRGEYNTGGSPALTPGATYYLSTTSGKISSSPPTTDGAVKVPLGKALTSSRLLLFPVIEPTAVVSGAGGGGGTTNTGSTTPTVESYSTAFESDGTITPIAPADIEAGNILLMLAATDEAGSATTTYTPPSGFNSLFAQQRANPGAAGTDFAAWSKVAGVSEPASYDLGESGLKNTAVIMLRVSGLDTDTAIDAVSCSTGTTEPFTAPSIDVTIDDALVLTIYAWDASKTVVAAPSGFTTAVHNDQSGVDLWVGYKTQATSGASGANVMDVTSDGPWVGCTISLKEPNATSTGGGGGGGGGASDQEGAGPFTLLDDGTPLGSPIKITLPIACNGTFVGSACEVFPKSDFHWEAGDPDIATYEHPTYFQRDPNFYRFCSPNSGATTSNAQNGRSELRYLQNHSSGVMSRQYIFRVRDEDMVNGLLANIGQIHRNPGSPVYKGTYAHVVTRANTAQGCGASTITLDAGASATDDTYNGMGLTINTGTGADQVRHITDYVGATKVATINRAWGTTCDSASTYEIGAGYYRILSKPADGGTDTPFNIGLGDKRIKSNLVSNSYIRVKYEWDITSQELKFWISDDEDQYTETVLSGAATVTLTGVALSNPSAYSKLGLYMNNAGDGSNSTPYCVEIWDDRYTGP